MRKFWKEMLKDNLFGFAIENYKSNKQQRIFQNRFGSDRVFEKDKRQFRRRG